MLDHEAWRQLLLWNLERESLWSQKTIDCVTFGTLSPLTKTNIWWKLYRWRWWWSSMWANGEYEQRCRCVRSPNCHLYTFMGTPPNCATGYRGDTVSQIMLWMEKMIMIIVVVRSLFSQNFSKRGGTFLHIYQTPKDGPKILMLHFLANTPSVYARSRWWWLADCEI